MKHNLILLLQLSLCALALIARPMHAADTLIVEQIQICPSQSIIYRGIEIAREGVYYDTLVSQSGKPDSIYRIVVNEAPSYYYHDTIILPKGQQLTWHGQTLKTAGTYYDYQRTQLGCDSVYELTLRNPIAYQHDENAGICRQDLPYLYKGESFYGAGDYELVRTSTKGLDSIFRLHLEVYESTEQTIRREICEGDTVLFRGKKLALPGYYSDTLISFHGCDSIVHLVLNYGSTFTVEQHENICVGDSFFFYDTWLYEEGVYSHTTQTAHGCDSTVKLVLSIVPQRETTHVVHLCQGESYSFNGLEINQTGEYVDTLLSAAGCDSIVRVRVTVQNTIPRSTITLLTCKDEPVLYNGTPYWAPTTFNDTLLSRTGCDSILTVVIQSAPNYIFQEKGSLTEGTYLWRGKQLTTPGIYYDSLRTAYGCDSVYQLTLCQNNRQTIHLYGCEGDSLRYRDKTFTQSSIYYDTLTNQYGCDSILQVVLHFTPDYHFVENKYICQGETYSWRGKTCYQEGSYFDTLPTINGCDSIYELRLTVGKAQMDSTYAVVCESELPYRWQGRNYYQTGIYTDSLLTVKGCDSLLILHLTVKPTYLTVEYHDICQGDFILVNDSIVTQSGTFDKVYVSEGGCDSICRTIVNVKAIDTIYQKAAICSNEQYEWRNQLLTRPNVYTDHVPYSGDNFAACDSVVYMLELEVLDSQNEQTDVVMCADSLPYLWRGRILWTDTIVADTFVNVVGCDSIFTLQLTVANCSDFDTLYLCPNGTLKVDGVVYDTLGDYRNQVGADTIHRFVIVRGDTAITRLDTTICSSQMPIRLGSIRVFEDQTRTDTVNIVEEHLNTIHGCDSTIEWHLTVLPSDLVTKQVRICNDDFYSFKGKELTRSGVYYDTLYNRLGCDSIVRLVLTRVETAFVDEKAELNYGGTYPWHGRNLTTSGTYYDTIRSTTLVDCDSIVYRLYLTVHEGYHFFDTIHICSDRLPYLWLGDALDSTGNYVHTYRSVQGADSIHSLRLIVDSAYLRTEYMTTCTGRSYTYDDTLTTRQGCDSIIRYIVNRATPSPLTTIQVATCQGEPYYLRGKQYTPPCVLHDTLLNQQGCDSVIRYVVNAYPSVSIDRYDTIIDGESLLFDGKQLHLPGTYVMRGKTALHGCDSIVRLHLFVYYPKFREDTVTLCYDSPNFPYIHNGREYRSSEFFKDTFLTPYGYDSIVWTHLLIYPRIEETVLPVSLCNDDVLSINGRIITQAGNYYDTLSSTVSGCDSILHYIVNRSTPSPVVSVTVNTCEGEPYYFRGKQYVPPCVILDTLLNRVGCDSVVRYVVNTHPTVSIDRYDTINDGETYLFAGNKYYLPGTYVMRGKTTYGCDSIVRLHLHVYYHTFREDTVTMCYNSPEFPYVHHGREYRESTLFKDTILNPLGYYDIVWTHLVIYPRIPETVIQLSLCNDDVLHIRGQIITQPGNYYDTLASKRGGCDSIIHYIVRKGQTYYIQQRDSFCLNEGYVWRGHMNDTVLHYTGVYYDRLLSTAGCDSIYELTLYGKPVYYSDTTILVCPDEFPIHHNGKLYYQAVMVSDTMKSKSCSCDSIRRIHYQLTNKCSEIDHIYRCVGETLHLGNSDIQEAGYYRFEQWTRFGLDSVYRVRIDTAYPSFDTISAAICQGDSILFGDKYVSTPGTHRLINDNRFGCDSLTVLNLTVYARNYAEAMRVNVADYELPYIWRNQPYLVSGNYEDYTYDLKKGCIDSVYRLQLNVIPTLYDTISYTICQGDSVQYNRQWYYRTTALMDTLHDMQTGRSAITFFDLQVVDSTRISSIDVISDCADAEEVLLRTRYTGAPPQSYSLRFLDDKAYQRGFTDQINRPFTQQIAIPIPAHTGTTYTQPDNYRLRISYYSGTCGTVTSDTVFTLRYPSWIMEQNWDHVIALLNDKYNGGYRFTAYRWSIPKKNITSTDPYFYSPLMTAGDTVIVALSVNGIDYIESCPFVVQPLKNIYHNQPILVYPTAAPARNAVVNIRSDRQGTWTLIDTAGRVCAEGNVSNGTHSLQLPAVSGCYLIIFNSQDGLTTTQKIVLY